jgi:multidrug efflux system outer membrane protein
MKKGKCFKNGYGLITVACLAFGFYGCMVGPKTSRPETEIPDRFSVGSSIIDTSGEILSLKWFRFFGDSILVQLVDTALKNNYDLKVATARMEQARAIYGISRSYQYPAIDFSAGAQRNNPSNVPEVAGPINNFSGLAGVSWELDLWGKIRHSKRAALDEYLASAEAQKAVQCALVSDVASLYFRLRDADQKLGIARRTAESRRASLQILRDQYEKGYVAELDVLQVEQLLRDAEAAIPSFALQVSVSENALNVLMGRNPSVVARGLLNGKQPEAPPIPSGLPASLLENRPDVRYAEFRYLAESERVGVAVAERFPAVSLTGFLGVASPELSDFLTADAITWQVAGGLTGPLINFGRNKRRVEAQRKAAEIAMYEYRKTFLEALTEVEDALRACSLLGDELTARESQVIAARKALLLSQARYDNGYTSYLEVLDAQRSLFSSELAESTVQQQRLNAYVQLYKALGGGW